MTDTLRLIAESWCIADSKINTTDGLLDWVRERNQSVAVEIHKSELKSGGLWFYDREYGCIRNQNDSFFHYHRFFKKFADGTEINQPIILQNEIGYLGIICREFDGVMHFLMQAKIEP